MKHIAFISFFFSIIFLSSCSIIKSIGPKKTTNSIAATNVLFSLKNKNKKPDTFKGIGRIKLTNRGNVQVSRIAWAGAKPSKMVIQVLNPFGQPLETLASDGKHLYLLSPSLEHPFYKKRSSDPSLQKIISLPIKSSDIITIITGGVPIHKYNSLTLQKEEFGNKYEKKKKKRWQGIVEKIYVDETKTKVEKIEFYNPSSTLLYRAVFEKMNRIHGYDLPSRLVLSSDETILILDIDRLWVDVPVSPSMFVLIDPREAHR